jgi:hypothetical protein
MKDRCFVKHCLATGSWRGVVAGTKLVCSAGTATMTPATKSCDLKEHDW